MHRRLRRVFQKLVGSALPFSILTGALLADRSETANPYAVVPARVGEYCTVCGSPLTEDDVALIVKGRRFPVDKSMVDVFLKNPQAYFRTKQIRGALFQEELQAAGATQSALTGGWFLFGLYILTGLVCAGLSGYIAVSKGLPAIPHFFAGFFLSVFGLLYVLTRSSHVEARNSAPWACQGSRYACARALSGMREHQPPGCGSLCCLWRRTGAETAVGHGQDTIARIEALLVGVLTFPRGDQLLIWLKRK